MAKDIYEGKRWLEYGPVGSRCDNCHSYYQAWIIGVSKSEEFIFEEHQCQERTLPEGTYLPISLSALDNPCSCTPNHGRDCPSCN